MKEIDFLNLKTFMEENFPLEDLMGMGFFGKGKKKLKKNDYAGMAKKICEFFGYHSIFQYRRPIYDSSKFWQELPDNDDVSTPIFWRKLDIDLGEILTQEKYLN